MAEEIKNNYTYNLSYSDYFEQVDDDDRHLYINADIDSDTIDTIVYAIMRYNKLDKDIPIEDRKPILIYINSYGGYVTDGYGVISAILASKTPVYTINQANCASMALLIFIAGHKRYAMRYSEFLLHDGSTFSVGTSSKVEDRMNFLNTQIKAMTKNYITNRTNISEEVYDKRYKDEWYFLPHEAKELGVVDYIVGEDCEMDDII